MRLKRQVLLLVGVLLAVVGLVAMWLVVGRADHQPVSPNSGPLSLDTTQVRDDSAQHENKHAALTHGSPTGPRRGAEKASEAQGGPP